MVIFFEKRNLRNASGSFLWVEVQWPCLHETQEYVRKLPSSFYQFLYRVLVTRRCTMHSPMERTFALTMQHGKAESSGCWKRNLDEFPFVQVFRQSTPPDAMDLVSNLLEYTPSSRISPLQACAHRFFDELRDPNTRLPNGRPLPPLFNFTEQGNMTSTVTATVVQPYIYTIKR